MTDHSKTRRSLGRNGNRRSKFTLLLVWMIFQALWPLMAQENPALRGGLRVLVTPDGGDLDPFLEARTEFPGTEGLLGFSALTAGAYYRFHPNLKGGLFYRLQFGALHNADWIKNGSGEWVWADTLGRPESVLIADLSPRFLLDFLPGRNWVFFLKNRYELNLYNGDQALYIRPGLTYTAFRYRRPLYGLGIHYAAGIGLNFGEHLIYTHQIYADGLYHLSDRFKLQMQLSWNRHNYAGVYMGSPFRFAERFIKAEFAAILIPEL
jgi:hypothetical protein